ncbi:MAG: selenide, water dikinase SelD [Chitinivibrionales bacterium]|nr:selenide, water dikinase SelD [Chitinivibrionales bacterium]
MKRSMSLGHCICDPKKPCPCAVFTDQGICPCAGERPDPSDINQVKLTELVHNAGCASKIAATDLERFLARLPAVVDPAIISGLPSGDDAAIYRISDSVTLVQTVDVFTPCVDDPYTFGKICAANCLSDIYAMGGTPKTALSILAFPAETLDGQIMYLMMKGAMEVLAQAHCSLIGGHSIKDEEIKLGFAITGTIDATKAVSLETARIGDVLVLTKPLGVGVLNFARQIGRPNTQGLAEAEQSMMELNDKACEAMNEVGVSACTDITGFGLFGHCIRMARHSNVTMELYADALPSFTGALEAFRAAIIPGAVERNSEFAGADLTVETSVDEAYRNLGFDAQTSGGLLIAVPVNRLERLINALSLKKIKPSVIGRVTASSEGALRLLASTPPAPLSITTPYTSSGKEVSDATAATGPIDSVKSTVTPPHSTSCCAAGVTTPVSACAPQTIATPSTNTESLKAFSQFIYATTSDGAIDSQTKELITFALVVLSRCERCVAVHREKALSMGISPVQLDEAAWCAIAMGGAPVRMFYTEAMQKFMK